MRCVLQTCKLSTVLHAHAFGPVREVLDIDSQSGKGRVWGPCISFNDALVEYAGNLYHSKSPTLEMFHHTWGSATQFLGPTPRNLQGPPMIKGSQAWNPKLWGILEKHFETMAASDPRTAPWPTINGFKHLRVSVLHTLVKPNCDVGHLKFVRCRKPPILVVFTQAFIFHAR